MKREHLVELGDDIVSLAAHIHAATQRLCAMIRDFDAGRGWAAEGRTSCADWLSWKTGMAMSTAYEHLRVAHALAKLPLIDEAFERGQLSYCKVRALTRVAETESEDKLLSLATNLSGRELEETCRGLRDARVAGGELEPERYVSQRTMGDGTVQLSFRLQADEAELVMKALREAKSELGEPSADSSAEDSREIDALMHLVEQYVSGQAAEPGGRAEQSPRRRAARTQLLVNVVVEGGSDPSSTADSSAEESSPAQEEQRRFQARLHESSHWLSREAFERLACDCSLGVAKTDASGAVLDVGRKRRSVPPALGRALLIRDRGCAFPGCGNRAYVDAHHIVHWSRGGDTKLDNLCLLCSRHHRFVHEGGFRIERGPQGLRFFAPDGAAIATAPKPTEVHDDPFAVFADLSPELTPPPPPAP